ncbi:MAG TPA: hypothetical protein VGQ62_20090, partial [Chloroflexota bacterium]|nr:hypothetical protein [Chloroflexota bacterium]
VPASLPELQYYFPRAGLSIDTLVRTPQAAAHLYVVTRLSDLAPSIQGWSNAVEVARFSSSHLFVVRNKS